MKNNTIKLLPIKTKEEKYHHIKSRNTLVSNIGEVAFETIFGDKK